MNSQDVIEVIETICDKLGIAINSFRDFVPELMKYRISSSVFWVVSSILIIFISVLMIKYAITKARKELKENKRYYDEFSDFPSVWVSSTIGGFLILIFSFVFLFSARNIILWVSSPYASAINYILSYLG